MKKAIVMISLSLILAGCGWQRFSNLNQIPVSGKIIIDKTEYQMMGGKYEWDGGKTTIKTIDTVSPIEIAKDFKTLTVEKDKKIEIVIEDNPDLAVYQWNEDGESKEVNLAGNYITVPSESGYFIYEVVGKWSDGQASYIFDVEIK
ncbi:hypothetical protein [Neobacillus sp. YIM B06451]|uniref:hypothetical protein n=1 Tax=Neobacillus sp. YIM B06451 TaxID=3070994 RepID=UPI00292FDD5E|nr:hypothetical protein [Neobacillus sp. YIM B06451]